MDDYNFKLYSHLKKDFWYILTRQDLLKKLIFKYKTKKIRASLDAGCGTGFNFPVLKKLGGKKYGVDLYKAATNECRKLVYDELITKDVNKLGYDNTFDLIIATDLLEHIKDDVRTLQKFRQYLANEGLLVMTVPAYEWLWSRDDDLAHHQRRYTKKELIENVKKVRGLKIKFISYRYFLNFLPSVIVFLLQKLRKQSKNSLEYTPGWLNKILLKLMSLENTLLSKGVKFPFGIGIVCVIAKDIT
jgi:predicted TPR repeat methyltransferase